MLATTTGLVGAAGSKVTSRPVLSIAVHCVVAGQSIAARTSPEMGRIAGVPTACGLNVTSWALWDPSTAVHWFTEGHATPVRSAPASSVTGVGVSGASVMKLTSRPCASTTVHWLSEGQETAVSLSGLSISTGLGVSGAVGLNVSWRPLASTPVHCAAVGQDRPVAMSWLLKDSPSSICVGVAALGAVGLKVTSRAVLDRRALRHRWTLHAFERPVQP